MISNPSEGKVYGSDWLQSQPNSPPCPSVLL